MPTPHISAQPGDFAPDVLMPGDPRRATRIAETLDDARLVTEVRGVLGYTGTWQGRPVSVMASGMGVPSISIYATELYRFYGVQRIIRIGTAGAMARHLQLGDVVVATGAHTDSAVSANRIGGGIHYAHVPDFGLAAAAYAAGQGTEGAQVHAGPVLTSDVFYADRPQITQALVDHGTLAVEMEAAGLYAVADRERAKALALVSISDFTFQPAELSADERERLFDRAVHLGLTAFATA